MNKDRIKAFIDDLAILYEKHGIEIQAECGGISLGESKCSFVEVYTCNDDIYKEWSIGEMDGFKNYTNVKSIDPSKLSAHEKFKWGLV